MKDVFKIRNFYIPKELFTIDEYSVEIGMESIAELIEYCSDETVYQVFYYIMGEACEKLQVNFNDLYNKYGFTREESEYGVNVLMDLGYLEPIDESGDVFDLYERLSFKENMDGCVILNDEILYAAAETCTRE